MITFKAAFFLLGLLSFTASSVMMAEAADPIACTRDSANRDMVNHLIEGGSTVDACIADCLELGYKFAGLQWTGHCFCDDTYGDQGPADNCDMECGGNCGGAWANAVYVTGGTGHVPEPVHADYVGCFRDSATRDMVNHLIKGGSTVDACIADCLELGYKFAGLQYTGHCFCDDTYGDQGTADNCDMECDGNCGGSWANAVYVTGGTGYVPPPPPEHPENYVGCYGDSRDRDMELHLHEGGSTVPQCITQCGELGYTHAGLQYGGHCFCDNTYGGQGTADNCDMSCSGECGGFWANSVYRASGDGNVRFSRLEDNENRCVGTSWGDPHIVTFDGLHYDAHALGELVFAKRQNTDFQIQIRTEAVDRAGNPAVTTGIVVKEDDPNLPTVQISLAEPDWPGAKAIGPNGCHVQMFVDEVVGDIDAGSGTEDVHVADFGRLIMVEYPDTKTRLDIEVGFWSNTCYLSIDVVLLDCCGLLGLLGNADGDPDNDWMNPEGTSLSIPPGAEAFFFQPAYDYVVQNWCIKHPDNSYFAYEDGLDFYDYAKCGNAYDPTLEQMIADAIVDPNDQVAMLCDGNIGCMVEGETFDAEAAENFQNDPANQALGSGSGSTPAPSGANGECPPPPPPPPPAPTPSGSLGDPHFRTWKNEHFEYHGQCDLILTKDPDFADGLGIEVQIRTKLVRFWSYINSAAIRIGTDILELRGDGSGEKHLTHYWINLEYQGLVDTIGGFPVTLHEVSVGKQIFEIDLSSKFPGQKITLSTYKEFIKVSFENASEEAFGNTVGMLGDFKSGNTLARDGSTVLDDFTAMGNEWQVLPFETMLFHNVESPQFPVRCVEPEDPQGARRRLEESSVKEADAEAACANLTDALDRKDCVYDILATQDLDMVGAY